MTQGGYGGQPDPFGGNPFSSDPFGAPPVMSAPAPQQPNRVNTLATLSIVFALVFAHVGAVLGHLGLAQIGRTGERGRERALIGVTQLAGARRCQDLALSLKGHTAAGCRGAVFFSGKGIDEVIVTSDVLP